ncbi:MAG: hypothetical protein JO306_16190, partial [Gemmatimonadetes bacterium]|nr:hypothetical protein [Gemmatimonadota bacterium]
MSELLTLDPPAEAPPPAQSALPHRDGRAPRLADGVERVEGAGGMPLLYLPARRTYTRLSALGDLVVATLARDPAPCWADVISVVASAQGTGSSDAEARLTSFLGQLWRLGVLASPPAGFAEAAPESAVKLPRKPMLKLPLTRPDRVVGERAAALLHARGNLALKVLRVPVLALGAWAMAHFVLEPASPLAIFRAPLLLVIPLYLLHIALHEAAHALAC